VLRLLAAMLATPLALPTPTSAAVSGIGGLTRRGKKGKGSCDFYSLSACEANCRNQGYTISTSCGTTG
jgi:hypothetical protein